MMLRFDPKLNAIAMDHLAPPSPKSEGLFFTYGPDLSFDVFEWSKGKWHLKENVPLTNDK
jgi:hypothetical protein